MRAGNDHDRHCAGHCERESLTREQGPEQNGRKASTKRNEGQPFCGCICEILCLRLAGLGFLDQFDDTRQKCFVAGLVDADGERTFSIDRTANDFGISPLEDGLGLTGQHGFVERRLAFDDDPVCRDFFARLDQQMLAACKGRDRHIAYRAVFCHKVGFVRHQRGKFLERPAGAKDRFHFDPVPEQHDCDQCRQFPEEGLVASECNHAHRIGIGGGDRDRDQRHHAYIAGRNLSPEAFQERPAAIEKHEA